MKKHKLDKVVFLVFVNVLILVMICYKLSSDRRKVTLQTEFNLSASRTMGLIRAIEEHYKYVSWGKSESMKFIILAMTDVSFTDMALNLYLSSFKRFDIRNFLFVSSGGNACERLNRLRIQCFDFWDDPDANSSSNYGSKEFIRKMNIRTEMILIALRAGFSVLHTDLDVVFLKNPMHEIETILRTNDMAILWDHSVYNAGFLAIKTNWITVAIYSAVQLITYKSDTTDDQIALNGVLSEFAETISVATLDKDRFLSGMDYYEQNRDFPPTDLTDNCLNCAVVHNNWIVSKEAKIHRFKETVAWYLDENGYYSDRTRRYLLLYNPVLGSSFSLDDVKAKEILALRNGLKMAKILNRTFILPRFHCKLDKECPLNSWFNVKKFHAEFAPNYRESSFLLSDLVPESISMKFNKRCSSTLENVGSSRLSMPLQTSCSGQDGVPESPCIRFNPIPLLLLTKKNEKLLESTLASFPNSKVVNLSVHEVLDESLLRERFSQCSDQVLVLSSLLDVEVRFSDPAEEEHFDRKLDRGLSPSDYIQNK